MGDAKGRGRPKRLKQLKKEEDQKRCQLEKMKKRMMKKKKMIMKMAKLPLVRFRKNLPPKRLQIMAKTQKMRKQMKKTKKRMKKMRRMRKKETIKHVSFLENTYQ